MRLLKVGYVGVAALLSSCAIDPSMFPDYPVSGGGDDNSEQRVESRPAPARSFVRGIKYQGLFGAGQVSYFRTTNSTEVKDNQTRICLQNATGQPKKLIWTKGEDSVNDLVVAKNGDRSCTNRKLNQRVEFTFSDRNFPVTSSGMNIGNVGGTLIEFVWVKDY